MHLFARLAIVGALSGSVTAAATDAPSPPSPDGAIAEVWAREADYWRLVKSGDAAGFESLWHENFIGWPCGQDHPRRKNAIGDWVRQIHDKHIAVSTTLTQEGAQAFGNLVVVHYRLTRVDTFPDGHVEGQGKESKLTHTWLKVGDRWLIVGGMCGTLPDSAT
jgi:hypothetical protein